MPNTQAATTTRTPTAPISNFRRRVKRWPDARGSDDLDSCSTATPSLAERASVWSDTPLSALTFLVTASSIISAPILFEPENDTIEDGIGWGYEPSRPT